MKKRPRPFLLAISLSILLSVLSGAIGYMYVSQLATQRLSSEVEKVRQSFGQKLASAEIVASAVQDLAHAMGAGELPESALQDFAASVMEKNPAIRSMLYYKRIDAAERTIFEADLAKRGITDGIVSASASDSNAIEKAAEAPEYFVLTTGDRPAIGNLFIGWNMLSDQARATALKKSLRRGAPTATDAYLLSDGIPPLKSWCLFIGVDVSRLNPQVPPLWLPPSVSSWISLPCWVMSNSGRTSQPF